MTRMRQAFTLIELLVVIAIIALLISILLPALKNARTAAWKVQSMSNLKQINTAAYSYREANKDNMPLAMPQRRGITPFSGGWGGWCTWTFGGKNNDAYWTTAYGGVFDIEAADRPLNPYLSGGEELFAPAPPLTLPATDPNRRSLQLPVFRDPSERVTYQRAASFATIPSFDPGVPVSAYDDVGTSYQYQAKWWEQLILLPFPGTGEAQWQRRFAFGVNRIRVADGFQPSRMVWINDQWADVVANNRNVNFKIRNGFGDINKSVMGFLDGHVSYHPVLPGDTVRSFSNANYTMVFEDLRLPGSP